MEKVETNCSVFSRSNFVYFNALPVVISSLAVIVVSKYAWSAHIKFKSRVQPLPLEQRRIEINKSSISVSPHSTNNTNSVTNTASSLTTTSSSTTGGVAFIRVVRESEEPYVFFRKSG